MNVIFHDSCYFNSRPIEFLTVLLDLFAPFSATSRFKMRDVNQQRTNGAPGTEEQQFPFFDLPPELRIMIYRHIVPFDLVSISQIPHCPSHTRLELCDIMRGHALTLTSINASQSSKPHLRGRMLTVK